MSTKATYIVAEIGGDNSTVQVVQAIPAVPLAKQNGAPYQIAFRVANLPPLGASAYKVSIDGTLMVKEMKLQQLAAVRSNGILSDGGLEEDVVASNEYYSVTFDR